MAASCAVIPDGYRVLEETRILDILLAHRLLITKKQRRYTSAARDGDSAVLRKHYILCPHCEKRVPAYARFVSPCFDTFFPVPAPVPRDTVDAWASPQYSFYPREWNTLEFNPVCVPEGGSFLCPHCGRESREYRADVPVRVSSRRGKLTLSCKTHDLGDLLRLNWGSYKAGRPRLPLEERAVFNLNTGKCHLALFSGEGTLLAIRNIFDSSDWQGSLLFRLLEENRRVKKLTAAHLRRYWPGQMPFSARELDPRVLVLLCRFVGFPRNFYGRTPFGEGSHIAARSFRATARRLHTPEGLQAMVRQSSLPQVKSVRRQLFQSPEYGFYLRELEFLYGCFGNTDLFMQLFDRPFTFQLLAFLHQYPTDPESGSGPGVFFRDYAAVCSPRSLLNRLETRLGEVRIYAVHYSCLPPAARKREQQSWAREAVRCFPTVPHSLPTRVSRIPDTRINGYDFVLLRTLDACHRAGAQLDNCLQEWEADANPVFAVKKGKRYLAAIEVSRDSCILQAYADHNLPLDLHPGLYAAYQKWMQMYALVEMEEDDPEEAVARPRLLPLLENSVF